MFPFAPTIFIFIGLLAGVLVASVGVSLLMYLFAATLVLTTGVAVHRSIPRKEK
jgi:hypothetical protein